MTRDFNKQNRDDSRSSFRNNSSNNRYGEERSPRPARVRLNRETVDRAWENGAPSLHANYRTRSTNGQPPRNNWRSNQNSSSNASGGNRAYGTRQNNYRDNNYRDNTQDFERRSDNGYRNPRPRPTGPSRSGNDQPRYNDQRGQSSSYRSSESRDNGYQRGRNNDSEAYNRSNGPRSQYGHGRGNYAPYDSDGRRYDARQHDSADYRSNSRPGSRPAQERGPRINKPEGEHPRRGAGRIVHPEKEYRPRPRVNELKPPKAEKPLHPRFLSRPEVRREREAKRYEDNGEQFEGDYEQFDGDATMEPQTQHPTHPARREYQPRAQANNRRGNNQEQERHVTQLPDGRVLKGSRPEQRRNAQFWTGVNNDTEALLEQVQPPPYEKVDAEQVSGEEGESTDTGTSRPPKRTPGTRSKKAEATKTTRKPRSSGPKPSQKGYKWPTS